MVSSLAEGKSIARNLSQNLRPCTLFSNIVKVSHGYFLRMVTSLIQMSRKTTDFVMLELILLLVL